MQEVIENYDLSACTCTYVVFIKRWDSDLNIQFTVQSLLSCMGVHEQCI